MGEWEPIETNEAQTITRLLRAMAGGTDAKENGAHIILGAAANLIDDLVRVNDGLCDLLEYGREDED